MLKTHLTKSSIYTGEIIADRYTLVTIIGSIGRRETARCINEIFLSAKWPKTMLRRSITKSKLEFKAIFSAKIRHSLFLLYGIVVNIAWEEKHIIRGESGEVEKKERRGNIYLNSGVKITCEISGCKEKSEFK